MASTSPPLAARLAEFQAVAEHARAERECLRHLRRRATIARKGIDQVLETVLVQTTEISARGRSGA
jgi:hypothetical protein